jgi:hypothetical protein
VWQRAAIRGQIGAMKGEASSPSTAPPLSVVIASTQPWPELEMVLDSLCAQLAACGGELVLADAVPDGGLPSGHGYPGTIVRLGRPGASVFELRAAGVAAARGAIIAITEDHCRVAPDWCQRLLEAHSAHPERLLIGGAVDNGALGIVDWASYFVANVAALPPRRGPWRAAITGQANMSFKRRLLVEHGALAFRSPALVSQLERRGQAKNEPRIRVAHVQSLGLVGSCLIHFHDGRCVAADRRKRLGGLRWGLELLKDLSLGARVPLATSRILVRVARAHPELRRQLALSAPLLWLMVGMHCLGELAGLVAGAGSSPQRMR